MLTQNNKTICFISKAIKIHGDKYNYSNVNYINAKTKINIICKIHGEFEQTPSNHLSKYNCQKCAKNFKLDTLGFIKKSKEIHKDIYDYSKVNYINTDTKIIIICKIHGEFEQQPDFHLNRKCGCPKCSNKSDTLQFIEKAKKIHKDIYDYSKVKYINNRIPVIIICKIHGEFMQQPNTHINLKCGCSSCVNKTEFLFLKTIQEYYPTLKKQYKVKWCKNKICLPFDFVIEELKIIIEIDGPQHFVQVANWSSSEIQKETDKYKINCANENGFSVIRLLQIDILKDNFDWIEELKLSISKINNEQKIQNIFICKNNEYDHFNI